jgi:type IV pilus assembly protein PilY1
MRTFVGTGDRYHLVDNGTQCSLSNPRACAQLGCTLRTSISINRDTATPVSQGDSNFLSYKYADLLPPSASASGNACKNPKVTLNWNYLKAGACDARAGKLEYGCTGDANTWSCSATTSDWVNLNISAPPPATSINRYYGFWSYGVDAARTFNTEAEARTYDSKRLRDMDLVDVSQFDATGKVNAATEKEAGSLDKGWYVRYTPGAERTGSGSTIIDGCVIWNSFEPSGSTSAVCSTTGTNTSRTYQASFVSGKANCAASFTNAAIIRRYIASATVAAPPEPAPQRTLVNGKVYSSAVIPGVGGGGGSGNQQFIVGENKEVLQSVYQLELDQASHTCRHDGKDCK